MQGECKKQVYLFFLPSRSHFYAKSAEMEVVFNGCWVFRDAKCGIYKPYWPVRRSASATTTDSQELRYSILGGVVMRGLKGEQYGIS